MSVKIEVNKEKIEEQTYLLEQLRNSLCKEYIVSIDTSKGLCADKVRHIAQELDNTRKELIRVIRKTEIYLKNVENEFEIADATVAKQWEV